MADQFTVSLTSALIRADSVSRQSLKPFAVAVAALEEESGGRKKVANDSTPVSLDLGGVTTAQVVEIRADEPVNIFFNGGAESTLIEGGGILIKLGCSITAIQAVNSGASESVVDWYVAGV